MSIIFRTVTVNRAIFCALSLVVFFYTHRSFALNVYVYDSFVGKDSLGALIQQRFEKKYGEKINYVIFPTAREALNQISIEKEKTKADILVGVDGALFSRARELHCFEPLTSPRTQLIRKDLFFDAEKRFIPYNYGYLAIVYDSKRSGTLPSMSFKTLSGDERFKKKLVLSDPRTSSIGFSFLVWSHLIFGNNEAKLFWRKMKGQVLTISPNWGGAYSLFSSGEADFVLSYTTSPAYHAEMEKKNWIKSIHFTDGQFLQVESVGMLNYSSRKDLAKKWIELLLSDEIQMEIPLHNWMYPVIDNIDLPKSFVDLKKITNPLFLYPSKSFSEQWIDDWTLEMMVKK